MYTRFELEQQIDFWRDDKGVAISRDDEQLMQRIRNTVESFAADRSITIKEEAPTTFSGCLVSGYPFRLEFGLQEMKLIVDARAVRHYVE